MGKNQSFQQESTQSGILWRVKDFKALYRIDQQKAA